MNIRIEQHHIYESFPIVKCDDSVLFYCFYRDWAEELLNQTRAIVEKYHIKTVFELEESAEYKSLKENYQLKKKEYHTLLSGSSTYDNSPFGDDVDVPIIQYSSKNKSNGRTIRSALLLAPGLCVIKLFTKTGEHNKTEPIYSIDRISRATWLLRVPNLEIAKMVCNYVSDLTDWGENKGTHREILAFLDQILQSIIDGKPFPPITESLRKIGAKSVSFDDIHTELNNLVGLHDLKDQVNRFIKKLKGEQKLLSMGLVLSQKPSMHMVFSGDEGTGKSEVTKIMAKLLYRSGYLNSEKVVEVTRSDLIGNSLTTSMEKTKKKIEDSLGGIFFIENADTLGNRNSSETEKAILEYLSRKMDEEKGNLVVILEGNKSNMDQLLAAHGGLKSRISYSFHFKDFTPSELAEIGIRKLESQGYDSSQIKDTLEESISLISNNGVVEGNARWVETFTEKIIENLMIRIADHDQEEPLNQIKQIDLKQALGLVYETSEQSRLDTLRDQSLKELNSMVGLNKVKNSMSDLMKFLSIEHKKREKGFIVDRPNIHMIFDGSPGTGKTTVARIIAKILRSIGWLSNGHLIEVSRSDLVGEYLGQTAPKVRDAVNRARGGILFIDEAYSLAQDKFGQEAVNELIKEMEDKRDELVIILAGYKDHIDKLMDTNPGFRSRIPYRFHFHDYSHEEIFTILTNSLKKNHLLLNAENEQLISQLLQKCSSSGGKIEGNGRFI
ncbi:AAA family ATPase [Risungbinella massiliensis]|uniref:AAA family ATPase n=1 Tax=Risungbinella massiliensis TaxID=1329796 RepID=UPI0005CC5CDA|nr:AAA family ATPase [Risungbinella massiliensis]